MFDRHEDASYDSLNTSIIAELSLKPKKKDSVGVSGGLIKHGSNVIQVREFVDDVRRSTELSVEQERRKFGEM